MDTNLTPRHVFHITIFWVIHEVHVFVGILTKLKPLNDPFIVPMLSSGRLFKHFRNDCSIGVCLFRHARPGDSLVLWGFWGWNHGRFGLAELCYCSLVLVPIKDYGKNKSTNNYLIRASSNPIYVSSQHHRAGAPYFRTNYLSR